MHSQASSLFSSALQGKKKDAPPQRNGPFLPQIHVQLNDSISDCNVVVIEKQGAKDFRATDYHLHSINKKNTHNYYINTFICQHRRGELWLSLNSVPSRTPSICSDKKYLIKNI